MKIVNLTQHMATPEQVSAGVYEPADKDQKRAKVKDVSEWVSCPNAHPAIISPELLALVRKRQERDYTT